LPTPFLNGKRFKSGLGQGERETADPPAPLRFGRDDKGEGDASMGEWLGQKAFFITSGGPQAPPTEAWQLFYQVE
jgi:hypothetical protein